jgi:hypothetical protein
MSNHARREFLQQSGSTAAATAAWSLSPAALRASGANEKITAAVIGPGGMSSSYLRQLVSRQDVQVAYVCDVDANHLAAAA